MSAVGSPFDSSSRQPPAFGSFSGFFRGISGTEFSSCTTQPPGIATRRSGKAAPLRSIMVFPSSRSDGPQPSQWRQSACLPFIPFAERSGQCRRCISGIRPHITGSLRPPSALACAAVSSTEGVKAAMPQSLSCSTARSLPMFSR